MDYWDKQLPIDFDRSCVLSSSKDNHTSAQQFSMPHILIMKWRIMLCMAPSMKSLSKCMCLPL